MLSPSGVQYTLIYKMCDLLQERHQETNNQFEMLYDSVWYLNDIICF